MPIESKGAFVVYGDRQARPTEPLPPKGLERSKNQGRTEPRSLQVTPNGHLTDVSVVPGESASEHDPDDPIGGLGNERGVGIESTAAGPQDDGVDEDPAVCRRRVGQIEGGVDGSEVALVDDCGDRVEVLPPKVTKPHVGHGGSGASQGARGRAPCSAAAGP